MQKTACFILHCVKYLKHPCSAARDMNTHTRTHTQKKTNSLLFFCAGHDQYVWRMTWERIMYFRSFLARDDRLESPGRRYCHGDHSESLSLFLILVSETRVWTSSGLSGPGEDFDSHPSALSWEADSPLFVVYYSSLLFSYLSCAWDETVSAANDRFTGHTRSRFLPMFISFFLNNGHLAWKILYK